LVFETVVSNTVSHHHRIRSGKEKTNCGKQKENKKLGGGFKKKTSLPGEMIQFDK